MADWTAPLPDTAVEGSETHVEDHNRLTAAIEEARSFIDAAETALKAIDAGNITTGTLAAARIPTLSVGKVTGLQSALDSKADADAVATLEGRIAALETEATEPEA